MSQFSFSTGRMVRDGLLAVCGAAVLFSAAPAWGTPQIAGRATGLGSPTANITAIRITGSGFGLPATGSSIRMRTGSIWTTVQSTDPQVVVWRDDLIIVRRSRDHINSGIVRVITGAGTSPDAPLHIYRFDTYPLALPVTQEGPGAPLAIAHHSPADKLYVNFEFGTDFQVLSASGGAAWLEAPPAGSPFALISGGHDFSSPKSALGDDAVIDPSGKVWFSLGGSLVYLGVHPNHSRIVRYDPANGSFRYYNVPGNDNEVIGLAWDATRGRLWFTSVSGPGRAAKLTSFDPATTPWDNTLTAWDSPGAPSLLGLVCSGGQTSGCFLEYPLPANVFAPAHILVDAAGLLWYTEFWPAGDTGAAHLGRLDPNLPPDPANVVQLPLPPTRSVFLSIGPGPWGLVRLANGDLILNEYFDAQLLRLPAGLQNSPTCLTLTPSGENPCLEEFTVPGIDLFNQPLHSIARDSDGNVWFTLTDVVDDPSRPSLGYLTPGTGEFTLFPPIGYMFPLPNLVNPDPNDPDAPTRFSGAGVAIAPNDRVWVADFFRRQIVRLKKRPN